ncbi:hypothetical protein F0T03_17955 [Yersinia canariae]|uniref:Uncharacterized protein n=1 Tax=Yersinia canariae TaxID=2607663 RepID=A0A857F2A6_9GAMM|nr:hypothetical protein [Yersinia canariae]QHB33857.1 hypothetical protein F0T03_17955 [Yersinia canariae]
MKLIKNKIKLYVFLLMIFPEPLLAQYEYFSCNTIKGVATLSMEKNKLIYRMTSDKNRFEFGSDSPIYSEFQYNHYSRFQTDYLIVNFIHGGYEYSIFSNYEGDKEEKGIAVLNIKSKKEYKYNCIKVNVDNLSDLTDKLQCNKVNALGCQ